jgi:hypothetical protein
MLIKVKLFGLILMNKDFTHAYETSFRKCYFFMWQNLLVLRKQMIRKKWSTSEKTKDVKEARKQHMAKDTVERRVSESLKLL